MIFFIFKYFDFFIFMPTTDNNCKVGNKVYKKQTKILYFDIPSFRLVEDVCTAQ